MVLNRNETQRNPNIRRLNLLQLYNIFVGYPILKFKTDWLLSSFYVYTSFFVPQYHQSKLVRIPITIYCYSFLYFQTSPTVHHLQGFLHPLQWFLFFISFILAISFLLWTCNKSPRSVLAFQ